MSQQNSQRVRQPISNTSKIYVAGHAGMVGSALSRRLRAGGYRNVITRSRAELDLLDQDAVRRFMRDVKPDYLFLAAAKVGGIQANDSFRADFIYENLVIEANIIQAAHDAGVGGLLFLGSSCIYPRECRQPIKEEYLLSGPLERTNEPYAVAKIAGIKLCEAFNHQYGTRYVSVMPTNLYGPNDNFDLASSHVIPALMRKFHEAKMAGAEYAVVWGTGTPRREFLHVDDLADACVFLMEHGFDAGMVNVGSGKDLTIRELAEAICAAVGFDGRLEFDAAKPDGTPRKLLDVSKLRALGWSAGITLADGLRTTYEWYLHNRADASPAA